MSDELDEVAAAAAEDVKVDAEAEAADQVKKQAQADAAAQAVEDRKSAVVKEKAEAAKKRKALKGDKVEAAPAVNLVIMNGSKRMMTLPPVKDSQGANVYDTQRLIPGENDVPSGHWDAVAGNKAIKIAKACGLLSHVRDGVAQRLDNGLDSLTPPEAAQQIARCSDIAMLTKFRNATQVEAYHKLIDARKAHLVQNA